MKYKGFWDRWAGRYDRFMSGDKDTYARIMNPMNKKLNRSMDVLELACGTGILSVQLAGNVKMLVATDFSEEMIKQAKQKCHSSRLHFSVQDAMALPYAPETFDAVIISNALHIMPQPEKALVEIRRVLKQDGILIAPTFTAAGHVTLAGCLLITLLSADFFIPMRQLGSFFHIAMNGMAASDKIFRLLDLPEAEKKTMSCPVGDIVCENFTFSYESDREILHGMDLSFPKDSFVPIVGESGCGKSTIASVLMGRNKGYMGSVRIGDAELHEISEDSLMKQITCKPSEQSLQGNGAGQSADG